MAQIDRRICIMIGIVVLIISLTLTACSPRTTAPNTPAASQAIKPVTSGESIPTATVVVNATNGAQRTFTADELATYDGMNGNPAYVAVNGIVYDVSNVKQWRTGRHEGYTAGKDLTDMIQQSPHGTSVLDGLPVVGTYVK